MISPLATGRSPTLAAPVLQRRPSLGKALVSMKHRVLAALVLIFLGDLFMRTYRLSDRGLLVSDESGYYGGPAATVTSLIHWWLAGTGDGLSASSRREVGGAPGFHHVAKPGYGVLVLLRIRSNR